MRPLIGLGVFVALCAGGCSLLFSGNDLHGRSDGGAGSGGSGGGGGDTDGGGGTGGSGGGGGTGGSGGGGSATCTPLTNPVHFTVTTPSVAGMAPYEITLSDIDHDGKVDIVTANFTSNNFSVLLGNGAGAFSLASTTPVTTCTTPQLVLTRDVTGDGLDDVIIACFDNSGSSPTYGVQVFVNTSSAGSVAFTAPKAVTLPTLTALPYIATGKFTGDANVDLAIVDPNSNKLRLFAGNGQGTFVADTTTYTTDMGGSYMTVGDLNGDGADDIVVYNETADDMTMVLSKAGGGFTTTTLAHDSTNGGTLYFVENPVSLLDINHDGLVDILVASGTSQPGTIEKFLNSGTATAPAFPATPVDIDTGDLPIAQGFADFNCDGILDIAVSTDGCDESDAPPECPNMTSQPPNFWLYPGHGTGYDAALTTSIALGSYNLAIADFNGDGYPDIATGSAGGSVTILMNTP